MKDKVEKLIKIVVGVNVAEFVAEEHRNTLTGAVYMPEFPAQLSHNACSYGSRSEAVILMLTHVCNLPTRKVCEFLSEVSGGRVHVSNGFAAGAAGKFACKAQPGMEKIMDIPAHAPVLCADSTVVKWKAGSGNGELQ